MLLTKSLLKSISGILIVLIVLVACNDNSVEPVDEITTDQQALEKIASEDEVLQSFDPNYDEGQALDFIGKVNTPIYPVRVGQHMILTNRNLNVTFDGDTAYGVLTTTFEGILFIAASYDPVIPGDTAAIDTLIQKPFTTQITRNIIFVKIAHTMRPYLNWRIAAVSLPEGGTLQSNVNINKMTIYVPGGDSLVIDSPNDYYLTRFQYRWRQIPVLYPGQPLTVRIELTSAYPDTDFVTFTFGAIRGGNHYRAKRLFELISETFDGTNYIRVFELTCHINAHRGFKHAIINAVPKQTIFDDATPVEVNTWGVPYIVL